MTWKAGKEVTKSDVNDMEIDLEFLDSTPFAESSVTSCRRLARFATPPIFVKKGCCYKNCEANRCCFCIGSSGWEIFDTGRMPIMCLCLLLSIVNSVLRLMPALTLGADESFAVKFSWSSGQYRCLRPEVCEDLVASVHVGLASLVLEASLGGDDHSPTGRFRKVIKWSDDVCPVNLKSMGSANYCGVCKSASLFCAILCVSAIISGFVCLRLEMQRLFRGRDHNCAKSTAVVSAATTAIIQIVAVSVFHSVCVHELAGTTADGAFDMTLALGTGGTIAWCSVGMCVLVLMLHIMVPTPRARWKTDERQIEDPAHGEWPSIYIPGTGSIDAGIIMPGNTAIPSNPDSIIASTPSNNVIGRQSQTSQSTQSSKESL